MEKLEHAGRGRGRYRHVVKVLEIVIVCSASPPLIHGLMSLGNAPVV